MIVADASAIVDFLLQTPTGRRAAETLLSRGQTIHAPHLLDIEVTQAIRRFWLTGALEDERAEATFEDLRDLPIERYGHELLIKRVWELRENMTAYDACYVALAELLEAPLLTSDARLAKAAGVHVSIELLHPGVRDR